MMFGFNQFFQFGFQQPNIDPILERAEGIDDILDEDNITTIVKSSTGSEKFGDYIRKHPEMIQNLIKYIIEEPELHEQMDQKRCFKYPFISSELFSCEIPLLINSLFEDLRLVNSRSSERNDDEEDEERQDNEFKGLTRQIKEERCSAKQQEEEIVEQIDIQCEGEDDANRNEFLENENNEKEKNEIDVEKYVDEVIQQVVEKLQPKKDENSEKLTNGIQKEQQQQQLPEPINNIDNNEIVGIKLMEYLLGFININTTELNETSAGYWAKVITAIINKRGTDFMDYLAETSNNFLDEMINFVSCRSIADIILKLILLEVPSLEAKKILYYPQRTQLVLKLHEKLLTSTNTYVHKILIQFSFYQELENVAYILSEIFNKYTNQYNGSQELVEFILTEENLNTIFKCIINQKDQQIYIYSLKVLESIFKFFNQQDDCQSPQIGGFLGTTDKTENKDEEIRQNLQQLLTDSKLQECFQQNLSELIQKLNQEQITDEIALQFNYKVRPFGLGRLKVLEVIYLGVKNQLQLNNMEIIEEKFESTQFFPLIFNLVQKYEWNNFLHIQIEKILLLILHSASPLRQQFFSSQFNLLSVIITTLSSFYFQLTPNRPYRTTHGNLMIFVKIANEIMELKKKEDELIVRLVEGNKEWEVFFENVMGKVNKEMSIDLGGVNPREKKQCPSENEREIDLANIFKKFSAFFSNSSLNSNTNQANDNNNNNDNNNDNDDDDKKKDEDDDDNDYNQLNKKYLDQDYDDDEDQGEENNDNPNEENHSEPKEKEKISLQKLKLQQLTAGGAATNGVSKAKNERNMAYAAYALKKNKDEQEQQYDDYEDDQNENSNGIQDQFNKNVQQFREKQQRLLKDMNKEQQVDDEDEYLNEQLSLETQKQLDQQITETMYNRYQYWQRDDYKSVDLSSEMIDELL